MTEEEKLSERQKLREMFLEAKKGLEDESAAKHKAWMNCLRDRLVPIFSEFARGELKEALGAEYTAAANRFRTLIIHMQNLALTKYRHIATRVAAEDKKRLFRMMDEVIAPEKTPEG